MIVFKVRVTATAATRERMLDALRGVVEPMRMHPGCVRCRLFQDVDDANALTWIEEWASREDLERHVGSTTYRTLLGVLDQSITQPEIRFDTIADTAGLECIADTRSDRHQEDGDS